MDPSDNPSAFKIKYTAIMDMKDGNRPKIIAIFINGFLILKRILDIQYETESTKMVEMIQVKIAIISVFMNILGKFRILVSVNILI